MTGKHYPLARPKQRPTMLACILSLVLLGLYITSHGGTRPNYTDGYWLESLTLDAYHRAPSVRNMVVGVKSSYASAPRRLPLHLSEERRDIPKQLFLADASFNIGDIYVHDSYVDASAEIKAQNQFQSYYEIQQMVKSKTAIHPGKDYFLLSRYHDTHVVGKMYKEHPHKSWYIVMEDDSFVFWQTLTRWLRDLDPNQEHYLGSASRLDSLVFAHGGGAFVMSKKLMDLSFGSAPHFANSDAASYTWLSGGDARLGHAIYSAPNVTIRSVTGGYYSFGIQDPAHSPISPKRWYTPLLSLGNMSPEMMARARQAEKDIATKSGREDDVRYCDVYNHLMPAELAELHSDNLNRIYTSAEKGREDNWLRKEGWLSKHRFQIHQNTDSEVICKAACQSMPDCWSFSHSYEQRKCWLSTRQELAFGKTDLGYNTTFNLHRMALEFGSMPCEDEANRQRAWEISTSANPSAIM